MGDNPSRFPKGNNYPVENVSWIDVQMFISRLNQYSGMRYRLPTEAAWEYAARGGPSSDRYGNIDSIAWFLDNSGGTTHKVGGKQPNAYVSMICWAMYGSGCKTFITLIRLGLRLIQ